MLRSTRLGPSAMKEYSKRQLLRDDVDETILSLPRPNHNEPMIAPHAASPVVPLRMRTAAKPSFSVTAILPTASSCTYLTVAQ